jgi:DNA-3-methyladenine glycosylase I
MQDIDYQKPRCSWVNLKNDLYINYHDNEWGVPVFDDNKLFEALSLEISQAGLSWEVIPNPIFKMVKINK